VTDDIQDEHDHHEANAQAKGHSADEIFDRGSTFEGRSNATAARHGIALTREDNEDDEGYRYE